MKVIVCAVPPEPFAVPLNVIVADAAFSASELSVDVALSGPDELAPGEKLAVNPHPNRDAIVSPAVHPFVDAAASTKSVLVGTLIIGLPPVRVVLPAFWTYRLTGMPDELSLTLPKSIAEAVRCTLYTAALEASAVYRLPCASSATLYALFAFVSIVTASATVGVRTH